MNMEIKKKNIRMEIQDSNLPKSTKNELLKLFKKGYGLFFSKILQTNKAPLIKKVSVHNSGQSTVHSMIEGDNLNALIALNNQYCGEFVDFIYIDPPYNTKTKLSYEDNRAHSEWLEMMELRLKEARSIMKNGAFIAISIDDNELFSLKLLMDDVFGEINFVHNLIWRKKTGGGQDSKFLVNEHEYVLVYSKDIFSAKTAENVIDRDKSEFNQIINGRKAKLMKLEKWGIGSKKEDAPTLFYPIMDPEGNNYFPKAPDGSDGRWRKKPENLSKDNIVWRLSKGSLAPYEVIYYDDYQTKKIVARSILYNVAENTHGTKQLTEIMGKKGDFDYPKPVELIEFLLNEFVSKPDAVILDFFAGSGTTMHAVAKLNKTKQWNMRSISVTWNEENNNVFDNVTMKRAKYVAKTFDTSVIFYKSTDTDFEFKDDYLFELSKNSNSIILIKSGATPTKYDGIYSMDGEAMRIFELIKPELLSKEIKKLLQLSKKMDSANLQIFLRDDQIIDSLSQSIIKSEAIKITFIPSSFAPINLRGF